MIRIEEIDGINALEAIAPEWMALWDRCPAAGPFQRPEWLLPWLRNLYGGGEILVLALRSEDRLVGLAAFFIHRHWKDFEIRQVSFIGAGISDYLDLLLEPVYAECAARAVFQHLDEHRSRWDICHLQEVRDSPLFHAELPEGLHRSVFPAGTCPVLTLPESMPRLIESLPHKFRTDLRRAGNRLRACGDITFETATAATLPEFLDALFRLHSARWELRQESGMLSTEAIRNFHRQVAAGFQQSGHLRVHGLRYCGDIAAVVYSFLSRGTAYAYLGGFDPALARFSPGAVLMEYSVASALAEGAREYDFLRKREEYKYQWGGVDRTSRRVLLWHSGSRLPSPEFPEDESYEE